MSTRSLVTAAALGAALLTAAVPAAAHAAKVPSDAQLHERCFTFTGDGRTLGGRADGRLALQATRPGTFLLVAPDADVLRAEDDGRTARLRGVPPTGWSAATEWRVLRQRGGTVVLRNVGTGKALRLPGTLGRVADATRLTVTPVRRKRCRLFEDRDISADGEPKRTVNADGTIFGFADTHLHITGDMRAGGAVLYGKAFDRFGLEAALGGDKAVHGRDGSKDLIGNLLRTGVPFGTHSVYGPQSPRSWPTYDTNTHQQVYWRWLERAWRGGLRLITATAVEDEQLCRIVPETVRSCDETVAIEAQLDRLKAMEAYIDLQRGGPGRGFFRIVRSTEQARAVMARGQLAVVLGVESSFPLGCRAQPGVAPCTTAQVDERLDALYDQGVRSLFIAHWADNGFAGAALQGGTKGKLINAMHRLDVGRFFATQPCTDPRVGEEVVPLSQLEIDVFTQSFPKTAGLRTVAQPTYPAGKQCNATGLTPLGEHLVKRMMEKGMLIEVDHLSHAARARVIALAKAARYPLISGHNETGGAWTPEQLRELHALGGYASQTLEQADVLGQRIAARRATSDPGRFFGVGLGTDTGGFATLPAPAADAKTKPFTYPFVSYAGTRFGQQQVGARLFDLNKDGMAHYGMLPDLLADVARRPGGQEAMALLFRSAEAYTQAWHRAETRAEELR
ncbi:MAG TPA: membrane dipeptidase [Solirubrobacteraceae bacterium]|nr:membrane dipeptidase [Solirubrobacteraceae bacterium]